MSSNVYSTQGAPRKRYLTFLVSLTSFSCVNTLEGVIEPMD